MHVGVRAGRDRREADRRQRRERRDRAAVARRARAGSGAPACRPPRASTASGRRSRSGRPASAAVEPSVTGERAQAGVAFGRAAAQRARRAPARRAPRGSRRPGRTRARRRRARRAPSERGDAAARAAAPERAGDERRRAERAAARRRRAPPTASSHCQNAKPIATATAAATTSAASARRSAPVAATPIDAPSPTRIPIVYQSPIAAASVAPWFTPRPAIGAYALSPRLEGARMSDDPRPLLVFFSSARSGPSRRMESLVAHIARKERHRLRVDPGRRRRSAPISSRSSRWTTVPTARARRRPQGRSPGSTAA